MWRTHSCVPRPHSWGRVLCCLKTRSHDCERGAQECARHTMRTGELLTLNDYWIFTISYEVIWPIQALLNGLASPGLSSKTTADPLPRLPASSRTLISFDTFFN